MLSVAGTVLLRHRGPTWRANTCATARCARFGLACKPRQASSCHVRHAHVCPRSLWLPNCEGTVFFAKDQHPCCPVCTAKRFCTHGICGSCAQVLDLTGAILVTDEGGQALTGCTELRELVLTWCAAFHQFMLQRQSPGRAPRSMITPAAPTCKLPAE